ncbi:MAG TPA: DUF1549 domain-containing protein [Gemmataceae bacterium]|nr:DUF1549 domain-containing protein [Gemmataceae bacterium]
MDSAPVRVSRRGRVLTLALGLLAAACLAAGVSRWAQAKAPSRPAKAAKTESTPRTAGSTQAVLYEQVRVINEQLGAQWKANGLVPSRLTTNYEFIRRVTLDIIGRIARPEEIQRFLHDPPQTRRALLIQRLLNSEEYARNWANIWTVWLMTRSGRGMYHEQMQVWLEEQFSKPNFRYDTMVEELLTATGKSDDNGAVNFVLSQEGMDIPGPNQGEEGPYDYVPLTSRTTRLFMGLQIQCCQCHDHPFNSGAQWGKQEVFWGMNAFFRQAKGDRMPNAEQRRMMASPSLKLTDDPKVNMEGRVFYEERRGTVRATKARFINGKRFNPRGVLTRRQQLADFVTQSPWFPKAFTNRMWGHFFGRGFTNPGPVDDFGDHNPVTHPLLPTELIAKLKQLNGPPPDELVEEVKNYQEDKSKPRLLDYLAKEFKKYNYDPRQLITWICNSEAYQLSSVANKTNADDKAEPFFSRMNLKAMSPEQLFESLMIATQAEAAETKENKKNLRDKWMQNLIVNFGDDEGNEVTFNGTVVQALMLMNGAEINQAVSDKEKGAVASAMRKGGGVTAIMDRLFKDALNRPPTAKELNAVANEIALMRVGRVKNRDPVALWQDIFWSLLNSNEFMLNH